MIQGYALNEAKTIIAIEPSPLPLDNLTESIANEFISSQIELEDNDITFNDTTVNIKTDVKSNISEKEEFLMQEAPKQSMGHPFEMDELVTLGDLIEEKSYGRKIELISLLVRKESIELMSIIDLEKSSNKKEKIVNLIFNSRNYLYTFGELIHNNLIYQNDDNIGITELCFNLIDSIEEGK